MKIERTERDRITIVDLEVFYRVGVPEEERARPQRLLLTVTLETDFSAAAAHDDLSRTIDYHAVSRRLLRLGEGREWRLLETLSVEIAGCLLVEYGAERVSVEIKKFILPEARHVGVCVVRSASSLAAGGGGRAIEGLPE